jgi:ankyrin repeat protein
MNETGRLFDSIQKGNADEVSKLIDGDPTLLGAGRSGVSPLLTAVYHRQPAIVRILLERATTLDVFEATAIGDVGRLRKLLAEDPGRVNAVAPDGFTPLGLASFFGHAGAAQLLLENGADPNLPAQNATKVAPLHSAVAGGNTEIVRDLLAHGADVHARQEGGFTPLHNAAFEGEEELIELLLAHRSDRTARSDAGKTPADLAREKGRQRAAQLLG